MCVCVEYSLFIRTLHCMHTEWQDLQRSECSFQGTEGETFFHLSESQWSPVSWHLQFKVTEHARRTRKSNSTISSLQPPQNNTEISSPPVQPRKSHCYGWMRRAAILGAGFLSLSKKNYAKCTVE